MEQSQRDFRRPMPDDFAVKVVEIGYDWHLLGYEFRASWKTIKRWLAELPPEVREAREAVNQQRWPNGRPGPNRRKDYVLGNRMSRERRAGV